MNFARTLSATLMALAIACPAVAGISEIGDDINARIARIKTERGGGKNPNEKLIDARKGSRETDLLGDGCNIAIGNVFEQEKSGGVTSARNQTTVVIQGDVIMANNRCK